MHKHGTKTTVVFLPADGEASWSLLPSLVSSLSGGLKQPENLFPYPQGDRSGLRKSKKDKRNSYYQRSSPWASLNYSNKARFSFNQPNRKIWSVKLVDVKHLPHKAFFCDTITRMVANQD